MDSNIRLEGVPEALAKLSRADDLLKTYTTSALYRISHLWKRTAVEYAPISPSTTMLKALSRSGGSLSVKGRKGGPSINVQMTPFYQGRLKLLLGSKAGSRPTPGGLMHSLQAANSMSMAQVYVPTNSVAGSYAFKIHEEKGVSWKKRGPGTRAKGALADAKFITRAATAKARDFLAILKDAIDKAITGAK
jgi:hypothetical protein